MVVKNVVLCDVKREEKCDIRIENGCLVEIGENLNAEEIIDAKGAYMLPSLIDTNIDLQDATLNAKNIKKISKEALRGGVGHLLLNATTNPPLDNEVALEYAQNALKDLEGAKVDLMINALLEDNSLSNIAILLKSGAIAPYMSTIAKNDIVIKVAEYVKMYDVTLLCKAEDNSLIHSGVMLDGDVSSKLGLAGIPNLSEVLHVSRMIEIARYFDIKILFKSIASPRSISLIQQAKQEGVKVSCEVSLTHLVKSDESCIGFNTTAKLDPPLASKEDILLLQKALQENHIDILTTLHQPSSPINKEVAFYDADYGSESLRYALPLYYTKLVKSGIISMQKLVELCVQNPAKVLGFEAGEFKVGQKIEAVLFDMTQTQTVENPQSLFDTEKLEGRVVMSLSQMQREDFR
jgi:dihydroorotase